MPKSIQTLLLLTAAVLILPLLSRAAEGVRFVHALTVYADEKGGGLDHPEGVACREGTIVVADSGNSRLLLYTLKSGTLAGGGEIKSSQLPYPIRVHLNSKGEILALDGKLRKVVRLAPDGSVLGLLDPKGMPAGVSPILRSFALDRADNTYLLDIFGARVIVVDPLGQYRREIPLPQKAGFFSDLAVDGRGTIYLLDSVRAELHAAEEGKAGFTLLSKGLSDYMSFPTYLTSDGRGGLLLVDRNGSGIVLLGPDGSYRGRQLTMGWKPGLLYYPSQVCLTGSDEAVIADRDNSRVQIYQLVR